MTASNEQPDADLARVVAAIEARRQASGAGEGEKGKTEGGSKERKAGVSAETPASPPGSRGAAHHIGQLRDWRAFKGRQTGIRGLIESVDVRLRRMDKRLMKVAGALEAIVGPNVAARLTPLGVQRGILTLGVDSSPLAYEVDRRMREGGLAELRQRTGLAINRVKVRIVADDDAAGQVRPADAARRTPRPKRSR